MVSKAGYEYLLAYKITVPIYDYTEVFVERHVSKYSRTTDQMVQAARSGMQNIAEGYKQESLKGYIKLSGVSRGSLEELLKDYHAHARHKGLEIWEKEKSTREIREISEIWKIIRENKSLPNHPSFPDLPSSEEISVNLMITLINQANYLLDKLVKSLKQKHMEEGGLTEELYRNRTEYRHKKKMSIAHLPLFFYHPYPLYHPYLYFSLSPLYPPLDFLGYFCEYGLWVIKLKCSRSSSTAKPS